MRVVIILCLLLPLTGVAQETFHGFYANAKAGAGNLFENNSSIALSVEGGVLKNNTIVGISYSRMPEFLGANFSNSVDATIGKFKMENSSLLFHAQAGLGIVWGEDSKAVRSIQYHFSKLVCRLKQALNLFLLTF